MKSTINVGPLVCLDSGSGAELGEEDEDEDQEEVAWLDALEAGEVNERGYLPQKRDSGSLTARQVI